MRPQGLTDGNGENGHAFPRVCRVTVFPSNAHVQETVDGVDVVVTTPGRGTFLIRRRSGEHSSSRCPLLRYEIRRIEEDVPRQDDPPRATPWIGSASEGPGRCAAPTADVVDVTRHPHWRALEEARYSHDGSLVHVGEADTGDRKQGKRGVS